ncbi:NifB/NifX family molybdenum-iron cluster-binding protein [Vibrio salinus]|uniref:NifB/NifX family molybdenum-iron cluster-binding protein n=1 Tax=Vibrio salinus TaxID=2899784 RepID=UPI001E301BE6|nr:NifB/NifX family molybdenum-iron cluster-binding protein [Vibrio salinus]MCE0495488.1 NifB/NifX family molybdenum-iron cluster-binding protein [Vibrio salinus]
MKAAFTIWNDRISPVFDVAGQLLVIETNEQREIIGRQTFKLSGESAYEKLMFISDLGVDELVCGAVSRPVFHAIKMNEIAVYSFRAGHIDDLVRAWQKNQVEQVNFSMPGCGRRGNGNRRGRGYRCRCNERCNSALSTNKEGKL